MEAKVDDPDGVFTPSPEPGSSQDVNHPGQQQAFTAGSSSANPTESQDINVPENIHQPAPGWLTELPLDFSWERRRWNSHDFKSNCIKQQDLVLRNWESFGPMHPKMVESVLDLVDLLGNDMRDVHAERTVHEYLLSLLWSVKDPQPMHIRYLSKIAYELSLRTRHYTATVALWQAIRFSETLGQAQDEKTIYVLNNLGNALAAWFRFDVAEKVYRRGLALGQELDGVGGDVTSKLRDNLMRVQRARARGVK